MTKEERKEQIRMRLLAAVVYSAEIIGAIFFIAGCERVLATQQTSPPVAGFTAAMNDIDLSVVPEEVVVVEEELPECPYTWDEQYLLAKLIYAEAGACKQDTTLAYVGSVVCNRVDSSFYPDDIYSVIYDTHWGIQYACAYNGAINKEPDDRCIEIAGEVLEMWRLEGKTYLPSNVLGQAGFATLHGEYTRSEGIIFSFY